MTKTHSQKIGAMSNHNGIWTTDGGQAFTVPVNTNFVKDPKKSRHRCCCITGLVLIFIASVGILTVALLAVLFYPGPLFHPTSFELKSFNGIKDYYVSNALKGVPATHCREDQIICPSGGCLDRKLACTTTSNGTVDCTPSVEECYRLSMKNEPATVLEATSEMTQNSSGNAISETDENCLIDPHFRCGSSGHCVHSSLVCDGVADCPYTGEDELECPCLGNTFDCESILLMKSGTNCIPIRFVCDGESDCSNGRDEQNCENKSVMITATAVIDSTDSGCQFPGAFQCRSGQCILSMRVCDGTYDCRDGDDERACLMATF